MNEKVCFLCDGEFVFEKWYGKCERCKILRPEAKEYMLAEMDELRELRTKLSEHLYILEQKYLSSSKGMTKQEREERDIWMEHNNLYNEIMTFIDQYDINKETRFKEIYPRLYSYVKIADRIRQMYQ